MSPEQVRANELDWRTDIFSLGAVLYEMATGRLPFPGASAGDICGLIVHQQPQPPSRIIPGLLPGLEPAINKAMAKDREQRYQSAAEIRADLQRLKRDSQPGTIAVATQLTQIKPAKRWSWMAGAAAAVLAAVGAGYLLLPRPAVKLAAQGKVFL